MIFNVKIYDNTENTYEDFFSHYFAIQRINLLNQLTPKQRESALQRKLQMKRIFTIK